MSWDRTIATEGEVSEASENGVVIDSWHLPRNMFPADVAVGERYAVQTVRGSLVTGVYRCVTYRTDADLELEHQEMVAKIEADRRARLEAHREEWTAREAALPAELRARLANFRTKAAEAGNDFDVAGWGYELVICELVQLYLNQYRQYDDFDDSEEITEYARTEGTSGNQHDFAKALAKLMSESPEKVGTTISALSPLGSGAYYDEPDF